MATALFILFILAGFHFIYESTILPSVRLELRYKLFKYRDQLIRLKTDNQHVISDEVFNDVFSTINASINRLPFFNASLFIDAKNEIERNQKLKNKIDKKIELIDKCEVKEVQELSSKTSHVTLLAFIFNFGGWGIYLFPILLLVYLVHHMFRMAFGVKTFIRELILVPDHEFNKMSPNSTIACV